MKYQRVIPLLAMTVILAVIMSVTAGCVKGSSQQSEPTKQTTTGSSQPEKTENTTTENRFTKKITITIGVSPKTGTNFDDRYWLKLINDKFNIDFKMEDITGEKALLAINSGNLPDLMPLWFLHQLMFANLFTDLTPYINEQTTPNVTRMINNYGVQKYKVMTTDGKILGFPMIITNNLALFGWTLNKTLLDEAGISKIPDTFSDLYELGMQWKAKNPEPQKYAFGGDAVNQIIKGFVLEPSFERDEDKFVLAYLRPVAKDAIIWLANAYKAKTNLSRTLS